MSQVQECALDAAVAAAIEGLRRGKVPPPRALFLLGTGGGLLPSRLESPVRASLAEIPGAPESWRGAKLWSGGLSGLPAWILEDAPDPSGAGEPPWARAFPCWLAAAAGAAVLVHTSAGVSLVEVLEPGALALVRDHLNLSGRTPLLGLSGSRLGPLFPDVSRLHHAGLRERALAIGRAIGVDAREAVAACALSPALETPAERRFFARAGAEVAVQGLEGPLLAAAHAGLAVLSIVCVTDRGDGPSDMAAVLAAADRMAPGLEEMLLRLAGEIARAADELEVEA